VAVNVRLAVYHVLVRTKLKADVTHDWSLLSDKQRRATSGEAIGAALALARSLFEDKGGIRHVVNFMIPLASACLVD